MNSAFSWSWHFIRYFFLDPGCFALTGRKGGQAIFFVTSAYRKSANPWTHSAIAVCKFREACHSANGKSTKFARKKAVFLIQICIGLPLIFSLPTSIMDKNQCISKLSQKPNVVLKFECAHLIFICRDKNYVFSEVLSPKKNNRVLTSKKVNGLQIPNLQMGTFVEGLQILKKISPQICRFAVCGTYLRTSHLWLANKSRRDMQKTVSKWPKHRVNTEWQWSLSGVHSIMMEKSA